MLSRFHVVSVVLASSLLACSGDDSTSETIGDAGIADATVDQAVTTLGQDAEGDDALGPGVDAAQVTDAGSSQDAALDAAALPVRCVYTSFDAGDAGDAGDGGGDASVQCAPPASTCFNSQVISYTNGTCEPDGTCHYTTEISTCSMGSCFNGACQMLVGR